MKFNFIIRHNIQSGFCNIAHFQEPLLGNFRFYDGTGSFGSPDFVHIVFCFQKEIFFLKFLNDEFSYFKTIFPGVVLCMVVQAAVVIYGIYHWKLMALPDFVVIGIMCRGNFQGSGSESDIHIIIFNHRNGSSHYRHDNFFASEAEISFVGRIHTDSRVSENGFGAGGGHGDKVFASLYFIFQVI